MKNNIAQVFRLKLKMHMSQHAEKMKIFIAEEKLSGSDMKSIKAMNKEPKSTWSLEREALNKAIKKEVAGLMNKVQVKAYEAGLR